MSRTLKKFIPGVVGVYQTLSSIFLLPRFLADRASFLKSARSTTSRFPLTVKDTYLCLFDRMKTTPFDPHYTYHPAWAARILAKNQPKKHIDIASILSFPTIVSAFIEVDYYDYRPANLHLRNLNSKEGNLHNLPFSDSTVESLSCMHTIEHIGLGRYGEPIDYDGDLKATAELARVLSHGGTLIFVTPVGRSRIEYNAHRIYSYQQVLDLFPELKLVEFSLIPDDYSAVGIIENADPALVTKQDYACGCFVFTK